jgi:hypothetical protein
MSSIAKTNFRMADEPEIGSDGPPLKKDYKWSCADLKSVVNEAERCNGLAQERL